MREDVYYKMCRECVCFVDKCVKNVYYIITRRYTNEEARPDKEVGRRRIFF